MGERIGYGRTAQTARDYGVSRLALVDEARHYAMSGHDGTGRILYDEARFEAALRSITRVGYIACPGYVGPASTPQGVRAVITAWPVSVRGE